MSGYCRLLAIPLLLVAMGLTGCGLADYEKRMDREQARVKAFDEENRYLGDNLEMPAAKEGEAIPFAIKIRLPKTINPKSTAAPKTFHSLPLYRYAGKEPAKESTAKGADAKGLTDLFVAGSMAAAANGKAKEGEWSHDDFLQDVAGDLKLYFRPLYQAELSFPVSATKEIKKIEHFNGQPDTEIAFEVYSFAAPAGKDLPAQHYWAYVRQERGKQLALVFHAAESLADDKDIQKSIDFSLKTLKIEDLPPAPPKATPKVAAAAP